MSRKLFIAGNWKMNKTATEAVAMVSEFKNLVADLGDQLNMAVCPPFTALSAVADALSGAPVAVGAQDISTQEAGAFTGEISAAMLLDLGVQFVIVGHSERRQYHDESDQLVSEKAKRALSAGLRPIICVGEHLEQREAGDTTKVVTKQVKGSLAGLSNEDMLKTTIAYEPVWAIGTGKTATPDQAQEVHALIRGLVRDSFDVAVADQLIIQYGGSVKPGNAKELMAQPDIDGALVGGASLEAATFAELIKNALD